MNSLPLDLVQEIFSRLSVKPIGRCRCVSKLWASLLCRQDFTELFLTRSSARPRLLFSVEGFGNGEWHFFSSPRPHSPSDEKKSSSLVVAADSHLKFPGDLGIYFCNYASGLVCFRYTLSEKEDAMHVICNPSTGQCASLPILRKVRWSVSFLVFDPIDKQFKVFVMTKNSHRILTLGTGKMHWRKIQFPLTHDPYPQGICINGIFYYSAYSQMSDLKIVCFDVRSEKFIKFVDADIIDDYEELVLICNKGKLGVITWKSPPYQSDTLKLCVWVLEDFKKQEWSKHAYTLPDNVLAYRIVELVGVTATGEIVFSNRYKCKPFYVYSFNPERNALQRFEIKGNHQELFGIHDLSVRVFLDHVEDLRFNIMWTSPPEKKPKAMTTSTSSSKAHLKKQDPRTFDSMKTTYAESSISPPGQKPKPTSTSTSFITPMALAILFFFLVFFFPPKFIL